MARAIRASDPAELAIFNSLFSSVAEEMGVTLGRTAHSPNIKERRDYSCAVFDAQGSLVAQAAHIPVHLGAMPTAVAAVMPLSPFAPGDLVILNDPYLGGTHLPDITMVSPVFVRAGRATAPAHPDPEPSRRVEGRRSRPALAGFVASRAHQADVGGMSPGSMPLAEELLQEGLVIPPIRLYERGRLNRAVLDLLLRNMRHPEERRGDLDAQTAAQHVGEARFRETVERYGLNRVRRQMAEVMDYAERITRAALSAVPDGVYEYEDCLDGDGLSDEPLPIRLRLTVRGGTMHCDFSGSAAERPSSVNAVAAVTRSAVYYIVRCLLDESVPSNDGCFRPVSFTLPERSIVNAGPPRAVAAGNVETSQRIVDVLLGALAQALPERIPAASAGSMNNVSIGGWDARRGRSFAYYETVGGGAGGGPSGPGLSAAHTHMTNTLNTPVEALELAYPFRVVEYAVRRRSGGRGRHRGGDGVRRTWEFLAPATVSLLGERRSLRSWGLAAGGPGAPGRDLLLRANGRTEPLPSKGHVKVAPGDRLTVETPGGGAWGHPLRSP